MNTLGYESHGVRPFPWRSTWTTLALGMASIIALVALPLVFLRLRPSLAGASAAVVLFVCIFVTFRAALKSRRILNSAGFRHLGTLILLIPVLLTPLALLDTFIATPFLASHFLVAKTAAQSQRVAIAFQLTLLVINNSYLENDEYPQDLHILLQTKDATLNELFPNASPDDLKNLRRMASTTQPLMPDEKEFIEKLANIEYHPVTLGIGDKAVDRLILSTRMPDGGFQTLGYSSGRIERILTADAAKIIAESKVVNVSATSK